MYVLTEPSNYKGCSTRQHAPKYSRSKINLISIKKFITIMTLVMAITMRGAESPACTPAPLARRWCCPVLRRDKVNLL